tara:strand:- start:3455 stop:4138 length:684 start_codon:yes stop_codon:yes gene_type:complete
MKKIYKIFLIFLSFIFLTTYSPSQLNNFPKKENFFFKIKKIEISNNIKISEETIQSKLKPIFNQNILLVKKSNILEKLESIDFLKTIDVKKKYPNTIIIKVYETEPAALLFKNKTKYILDTSSNIILFDKNMDLNELPNVFGDGAKDNFINFLEILKENNFPFKKVKNFYHFQIGRWDVELINNQLIKFPFDKLIEAVQQSAELLNRSDFKKYNVIDLRIHDKIVVE